MPQIDQAEAVEESVEDRMERLLDLADNEPEEEIEDGEAEEPEDDAESEDDDQEEATEELLWNGETKVVTKTELKELAQKGYDYTAKTQALAEDRKSIANERQALQVQAQLQSQQLDLISEVKAMDRQLANYKEINWAELAESDPIQYLKHNHAYRDLKEQREAKVSEYHEASAKNEQAREFQNQQFLERESRKLAEEIPEFRDPEKAKTIKTDMKSYLKARGYNDEEIGTVMDSRMVKVIYDAVRYSKVESSKPAITKRVETAPKSVKPGAKTQTNTGRMDAELRSSLKKTGRSDYATKLIERML